MPNEVEIDHIAFIVQTAHIQPISANTTPLNRMIVNVNMPSNDFNHTDRDPRSLSLYCVAWLASLFFMSSTLAQGGPTIYVQPQSQTVLVGADVTFSVGLGQPGSATLPSVSSGTLQLWLKADAGVTTNASGQVSLWKDQSANMNDASQLETDQQPSVVYPAEIGGLPAIRFNGDLDTYLIGSGAVGVPNAITTFTVANVFSATNNVNTLWLIGDAATDDGGSRSDDIFEGDRDFSTWHYDYQAPFAVPTNTWRIWTDRVNASLTNLELFDTSASGSTNFSAAMPPASAPASGYYVGGINPFLALGSGDKLDGDIAEWLVYSGSLTDSDRLAVLGYLQQKYDFIADTNVLGFQWQFDGTNIAGATTSSLTLVNVTTNEAGSYRVIVTNSSGPTISSNAILTVLPAPLCVPAPSGLVGWWPAEGNATDVVNTDNGTLVNGVTFAPGEVGQAFNFNGNFQYVQIPDSISLEPVSVTLECWFNVNKTVNNGSLIGKPAGPGSFDSYTMWLGGGKLNAVVGSPTTLAPIIAHSFSPSTNVWYHAAFTFDDASQNQILYVNGVAVATNHTSVHIGYDAHPVLIGSEMDSGSLDLAFNGRIDEVSLYNRALTAAEIAGIYAAGSLGKCGAPPTIVVQPQSQNVVVASTATFSITNAGTPPFAYQWSFDATNIVGATFPALVLTGVDFSAAGAYAVTVTNAYGSATSSNAILAVGVPPSVTITPLNLELVQGTNVTFTATAAGTEPLSFQWSFNGSVLGQETNSSLSLTNVQSANAGIYAITVTNAFGTAFSSNAVLKVDLLPVISAQPQSQEVSVGSNVTFSVTAGTSVTGPPSVTSGTLRLWLKADTGVITNSSGQVSLWQDQSGNANDASQSNPNLLPNLVYPSELGGEPAVRFNGIQDGADGDYLSGSGSVDVPNAMTAFTVYNFFDDTNRADLAWLIGVSGTFGGDRILAILNQELDFDTYAYDYQIPAPFPINTYRICTDRVNADLSNVEIFDTSETGGTNISLPMASTLTPAAGYYVGGVDPAAAGAYPGENMDGDIAEIMIYSGYLTDLDRLGVFGYLQQKYFQTASGDALTYQWQFDGTNIAGATNSSLTLTDVQYTNAGNYSVTVSEDVASTVSSNALLTITAPPSPILSISQSGNNVVLSWPSGIAWELQSASLLNGTWTNAVGTPLMIGTNLVLPVPISTNTTFYRLKF